MATSPDAFEKGTSSEAMNSSPHPSDLPRIAILGAGNMGTALAQALSLQTRPVAVWDPFPEVIREIREHRTNRRFLPTIQLDPRIHAATTAEDCVRGAGIVILCVPSAFAAEVLRPLTDRLEAGAIILNVAKGFSPEGDEILPIWLEGISLGHPCAHLAGPALANEIARGKPTFIQIAAAHRTTADTVAAALAGTVFVPSVTTDLKGAALCGILKNSYAIFLGLLERIEPWGRNLQATAITLCGMEMEMLLIALGAAARTVRGLAGIGDLMATGIAPDSHNRKIGISLGDGHTLDQIRQQSGWLPEGIRATPVLLELAHACRQRPPLLEWLGGVLAGEPPKSAELMAALKAASGGAGSGSTS